MMGNSRFIDGAVGPDSLSESGAIRHRILPSAISGNHADGSGGDSVFLLAMRVSFSVMFLIER